MGWAQLRLVLSRIAQGITKSFKRAASIRVLLFVLSGALVCTAAVYAFSLWREGVRAEENAQGILRVSGFAALHPAAGDEEGRYRPPQEPAADTNALGSLFDSALQGYSVIARLDIPSIGISLPVLSEMTDEALKYSVCYYTGPNPGKEGNLVITGHNYASGAHFGNLDKVREGDTVSLTDPNGNTFVYMVYKTELVTPDDAQALSDTQYEREVTLLTCEENANRRLLVRCYAPDGQ
jgi:sortase A